MAKIVDLKQGTGNVFPRTIGEAVAVDGKLLTEAISNLDEKVSAVSGLNDLISGESTGTVNVAPNASDIYIGNDGNPNQRVRIIGSESVYAMSKHIVSLGTDTCNIEISPQMGIIIGDRYDNNRNNINIGTSDNSIKIGHTYNSIQIGSDYSISIGTYNGIDINSFGKISIGAQLTNDVIIGTTYNNIKLSSDCSITIGTKDAIKIDPFGKVTFGPNSGVSIGGGGGGSSDLDINMSSGVAMDIGWQTPDISIGTKRTIILDFCGKQIGIMNDPERSTSFISMSTANGILMKNNKSFDVWAPSINLGTKGNGITISDHNNTSELVLGAQDAKIEANSIEINSIESFMINDFKIITDTTTDTITFLNTLTGRSITLQLTDPTTIDTTGTTGSTGLTSGT